MPERLTEFAWPMKLAPQNDRSLLVTFPDFPEAITDGADREEALQQAADCLEEAVAARIAGGEDIPAPSRRGKGALLVVLAPLFAAKAALYMAMRDAGISKSALARRMGCDEKEIRRLLDPRHGSKIERIDEALSHLDHRLQIRMAVA